VPLVATVVLAGCTEDPAGAGSDNNLGYISGSPYKEIKPADRKPAVKFSGVTESGDKVSSSQFLGKVHVINFWYAGCGPCIREAPRLESAFKSYNGAVPFLGVNTYDQAATAINFETAKKVTYPSVIDVNDTAVQFAFSASVPANAVPTTLIIDQKGRVAARVTGVIEDASILKDLINTVVAEGS
jgi:thiol-disulfide isomerase/thioredoxin